MKKRSHVRTSKRKPKLSPFARLKEENAYLRGRLLHAVDEYVEVLKRLGDALGYVDRLMPQSKSIGEVWTAADVKHLAELRELVKL